MPRDPRPGRLFLLPFLHLGVGRLAADLIRACAAHGERCFLVTAGAVGGSSDEATLVDEVRPWIQGSACADVFSREPHVRDAASALVGECCRRWDVSTAHAFTAMAAEAALPHVPVVATAVGWAPDKALWQRQMDVGVLERCARVTAVSTAMIAELRTAGLVRDVSLVRNGVKVGSRSRPAERRGALRVAGVMAHLIDRKGVDVALRAIAALPAGCFEKVIVAGEGEARASLEALAAGLTLPCGIEWTGQMPIERFLDAVDLVIVPSRSDALPMVLLEALAYGLPVAASRTGGIPEAVTDGVHGWLVEPEDVSQLAQALRSMTQVPEEAWRRAERGRTRVQDEFSAEGMIDAYRACHAGAERARLHASAQVRNAGQVQDGAAVADF